MFLHVFTYFSLSVRILNGTTRTVETRNSQGRSSKFSSYFSPVDLFYRTINVFCLHLNINSLLNCFFRERRQSFQVCCAERKQKKQWDVRRVGAHSSKRKKTTKSLRHSKCPYAYRPSLFDGIWKYEIAKEESCEREIFRRGKRFPDRRGMVNIWICIVYFEIGAILLLFGAILSEDNLYI